MPQLTSDEAANDEPTAYNVEECEDDQRWHENLNDIKVDLVEDLDRDSRSANNSKSHGHGETSNKDRLERDPRDDIKGPGRPAGFVYPPDIGSIVSGLHPNMFANGGLPPNSKVPYPYSMGYHAMLFGPSASTDIDGKSGMPRTHPDIPHMYSLPGSLGQVPHPLAPWPAPPIYPICTASTAAMASMLRYPHPFAAFTSSATAAAVASNMPRFPLGPPHPHGPGIHPTMIPHPALVSNGPLSNMGNGQHPHHVKHDQDKCSSRHSKSDSDRHPKRDRPYVKKPLNAFMLYMKEQRAKVVAECTLKESAAINQILGRKWHSLSREEQQKYYEMARKERQLHLQLYPGWSARDNYGKRKKRKKEKSQGECTAQNPKKCRAVFGLEQQQLWCAPCRRKKKCVRYQHDDDSDDDDLSPVQSPQFQNFPGQSNPFDAVRSTSPLSMTSHSNSITNGNGEYGTNTSSASRLPGNQISPLQPGMAPAIKEEFRMSPVGMDGHHSMTNGGSGCEPYTNRRPGRAPSSDNSFKSEGSPNSQGGDSGIGQGHRRSNDNSNNNNNGKELSRRGDGDCNRPVANGNPPQNAIHRQASAPSGGENRSSFRKTNSLDGSDMPGPSGLAGRGNHLPHNTSGNSSADSPGSGPSRTHHGPRNSLGSHSKMPGGSGNPSLPHPSPQHPPSTGLFLPPHSPSYSHPSPHGAAFMPPYSPYFGPSMLAAFGGTPPSPLSSLMFPSFKGISPPGMGGPNPGSSSHSQARMTPGAVVEGKS